MRGHRCTPDVVQPLEHLHPASGSGQVGGGYQAVVPAADDDDVGPGHRSAKVALDLTGRAHPRRSGIAAGLPQGPALPQQVPALVERHFQGAQPLMLLGFVDLAVLQLGTQLLLLGDQLVDPSENVLVLGHASRLR